jgi:hypothetical protein
MVMEQFTVISHYVPRGTEVNQEELQKSQYNIQNLNQASPKYKSAVLPLQPMCSVSQSNTTGYFT